MTVAERLRELADRTTAERTRPETERSSGAVDGSLTSVSAILLRAADLLDAGGRPAVREQLDQVAFLVGDGWSVTSDLGGEILQVVRSVP